MKIKLISYVLCPYVQRAVISLKEKNIPFERIDIDLANKPDWFLKLSPLGKTPVLQVDDQVFFESNVILEFLEDILVHPLHPEDPVVRARHRSMIEFSSALLNDIAGFYGAKDQTVYETKKEMIQKKFIWLENALEDGPWFNGENFSLVDVVYGPVFRYFDTFEQVDGLRFFDNLPRLSKWRAALSQRASVQEAVIEDYPDRLRTFLLNRNSYLSQQMAA
ncbi:glutathione S-transferase family protein [Terasakiella sp. A23]|uniref:glutathione S-transferase family protein n=1 Tax=Terasakiella sp. FCG-A23 TaxID=3080561 RepID=UPI002952C663|nr:glutathione S-transferase family protein [Terasakiella sp. A23]MDV7338036.1 glutathione S-transferase family protein [Terasakiella sp. A23]